MKLGRWIFSPSRTHSTLCFLDNVRKQTSKASFTLNWRWISSYSVFTSKSSPSRDLFIPEIWMIRVEITDGSKESERSTAISPAESSGRYMATANDSVWIFTWLSSCFLSNKEPLFILSWRPSLNCLFGWAIVWIIVTFLSRRRAFEWFRGRMTTALS